jgi:hypothetical protein
MLFLIIKYIANQRKKSSVIVGIVFKKDNKGSAVWKSRKRLAINDMVQLVRRETDL